LSASLKEKLKTFFRPEAAYVLLFIRVYPRKSVSNHLLANSVSPFFQDISQRHPGPLLPMNQFDGAGFFGHGSNPIDQSLLVGMGGVEILVCLED
jgi:hypothetical protein